MNLSKCIKQLEQGLEVRSAFFITEILLHESPMINDAKHEQYLLQSQSKIT
jgi:hypothetical protein